MQYIIRAVQFANRKTEYCQSERHIIVGYRPKGGNCSTPQVNIAVDWLAEAGFEVGTCVNLKVLDGGLLLIPDSSEKIRLPQEQAQLEQE